MSKMLFVTLAIALCVFILETSIVAQEKPEAVLVDEFANPNCEDLSAHMDMIAIQIDNNPKAIALIAITGKTGELRNNLFNEGMIKMYFQVHHISNERWRVVRTGLGEKFVVQFWLVPAGSSSPVIAEANWSYELPPSTKPFIFDWGESYATDVCPAVNGLDLLSDVLNANPTARTNVVLRVRNSREYKRRKTKTIRSLTHDFSIPRKRIRIFMITRSPDDQVGIEPDAEYWLVPNKD